MPTTRKAATTTVVNFTFEKETKGTRRYKEDGDDAVIGTLYIRKAAAEALGNPEKLVVTIEAVVK